jgi:hypothetical protein
MSSQITVLRPLHLGTYQCFWKYQKVRPRHRTSIHFIGNCRRPGQKYYWQSNVVFNDSTDYINTEQVTKTPDKEKAISMSSLSSRSPSSGVCIWRKSTKLSWHTERQSAGSKAIDFQGRDITGLSRVVFSDYTKTKRKARDNYFVLHAILHPYASLRLIKLASFCMFDDVPWFLFRRLKKQRAQIEKIGNTTLNLLIESLVFSIAFIVCFYRQFFGFS